MVGTAYLHIEQIFPLLPIYHVAVSFKAGPFRKRYDFHPARRKIDNKTKPARTHSIKLGTPKVSPWKLRSLDRGIDTNYMLFINDCRHFTKAVIDRSKCGMYIDITNMFVLHHIFVNSQVLV